MRAAHIALRSTLALGLLCAVPAVVLAERLPIKTYTTADGLAHENVKRIVADSRGFLWFATRQGLSRFDGQRFLTYGVSEGLPNPTVNHVLETSRGAYWIATNGGGVCRLNQVASRRPTSRGTEVTRSPEDGARRTEDRARFTVFPVGETPEANRVNVLHEDAAGQLWAGTDGGLFRLQESNGHTKFERVELSLPSRPDRAVHVWAFADDRNGSLWIGTSWGLVRRFGDGRSTHYAIQPVRGTDHVWALLNTRDDRFWVGHDSGLIVFNPEPMAHTASRDSVTTHTLKIHPASAWAGNTRSRWPSGAGEAVRFTKADGLSAGSALALHQSIDGELWIGTADGVTHFDGERFHAYTSAQGISEGAAIAEDRDGHIWIAGGPGAVKLTRAGFVSYTEADGLSSDVIQAVFESRGKLHVVSLEQVVHRFDETRFIAVRPNLSDDAREADAPAFQDRTGEWWVSGGAGLYRFPAVDTLEELAQVRPKAIYTTREGLAGDDVFGLFEDSRGDIWIARRTPTQAVLTRWERATDTFHRYSDAHGLPTFSRPLAFAEDRSGAVWVGFWNGGLARYRDGGFIMFTTAEGAPDGAITALYVDSRGRLWVGSGRSGVGWIDPPAADRPRFITYTTAQGLSGDGASCITEDQSGRLYFGTRSGLDRLDPATGRVRHFDTVDGLAGSTIRVAFRDRRGTLWFGTAFGLSRLSPAPDRPASSPRVFIGGLRIAGESRAVFELGEREIPALELGPSQNQVQIDFFSIDTTSALVRYQYRLDGVDRGWSVPADLRSVNYASLAPGRYRFLVRAVAADGALSQQPASVAFTILPPIWQRWWFLTLATLVMAALVYALYRVRVARLIALERVRTRIATDLHDDLGSNLSQIAILSEVLLMDVGKEDRPAATLLSRITATANESVESMSDIVWAINPKGDSLRSLMRRMRRVASDTFTARNIDFDFRAPEVNRHVEMGADIRRNVFLLFKEAVNNIIRHSKCTRADIEMQLDGDNLLLRVSDNGQAFDTTRESDGHGLVSMRQRARDLDGTLDVISEPGKGTTISLRAPLSRRRAARARLHT